MANEDKIPALIEELKEKYAASGQDIASYLEGLLYSDYLNYWDYIHLDTLLTLQTPRTNFPDENIFIMYHQVTELYLKMMLQEAEQICDNAHLEAEEMEMRIHRINRYMEILTQSFDVMYDGMQQAQFLKFRMALLPASGFQSAQFRMMEIVSTDFDNLLGGEYAPTPADTIASKFNYIYWLKGATELATGAKTLTLKKFESKYGDMLIELGERYASKNIYQKFLSLAAQGKDTPKLIDLLKRLDVLFNITWRLMHLRSTVQYLHKEPEIIAATGGTNWQQYLPPKFQKRCFFPSLWSDAEMQEWGKDWVKETLEKIRTKNTPA